MVERVLTGAWDEHRSAVRRRLGELATTLARLGVGDEDQATLASSLGRLDSLFLLVVAGEFNAGKSAFINALIGDRLLTEGVTPTTSRIHVLRHGDESGSRQVEGIEVVTSSLPLLREIEIVDTPGTNAIVREHEAITQEFVPNADLVLFVTSADRPLAESERAFLEQIRQWGKKVVLVLNKVDLIASEEDVERIESFIVRGAEELLGAAPTLFPVSARLALAGKLGADGTGDPDALERSRFPALEAYIVDTLDEAERIRLKLLSPLGVGERLAGRYHEVAAGRLELLRADLAALESIERQLELYREDMSREFRFRLSDVDKVLHAFENRGNEFFDDTLRVARVVDLLNKSRLRADFERKVVADVPQQIERKVGELIDWMVGAELKLWQSVSGRIAERRHAHAEGTAGDVGGGFDADRSRLLASAGAEARRTVETYDRERESARLADSVQTAVAGAALLEVGAIGLGATVAALATSTAVDVTGLLAASALAVIGLVIIPARRRKAKAELKAKVAELRQSLMSSLEARFDEEIEATLRRVRDGIAPYSRFVRAESDRLREQRDELAAAGRELADLRSAIERTDSGHTGAAG